MVKGYVISDPHCESGAQHTNMSMKEAEVLDQKIEVFQKGLLSLSVPTGETTQMCLVTGECWWIGRY